MMKTLLSHRFQFSVILLLTSLQADARQISAAEVSLQPLADTGITGEIPFTGFVLWENRSSNPNSEFLRVEYLTEDNNTQVVDALMEFDLSDIPANASIDRATLYAKVNNTSEASGAFVILNGFPSIGNLETGSIDFYGNNAFVTPSNPPENVRRPSQADPQEFEVTELVEQWHLNGESYGTFQFSASEGEWYEIVGYREGFSQQLHELPSLIVEYTVVPEPSTLALVFLSLFGLLTRHRYNIT